MTADADRAREILAVEADALRGVGARLGDSFGRAIDAIVACEGHVIVCGVGKPWFIAQKISATMASTGTPSFPLHPADALHGDIGRVQAGDVVIVLSNSGSSDEVVAIVPFIARFGATLIALTGNSDSPLGKAADILIDLGPITEAGPLGLAPSASSTALLGVGDALTLVTLERRDFTHEDYAKFHPAGALGQQLRWARDAMRPLDRTPCVRPDEPMLAALQRITELRAGAAFVLDADGRLLGIFTDGDLRRHVTRDARCLDDPIADHMTADPTTIGPTEPLAQAHRLLAEKHQDKLPVVDNAGVLLGHLDAQDIL